MSRSLHLTTPPLAKDAVRFSIVGIVCYGVDVLLFNGLRLLPVHVINAPLVAKTIAVSFATLIAWLGTRYWTFRKTRRSDTAAEFSEFILVALGGYGINMLVLAISHYVLGFHSLLADNISGNLIGALLGTILRFVLYRQWVYHERRLH